MRNGIYQIAFQSPSDSGTGFLTFEDGVIYGVDVGGAKYDGDYTIDEATRLANVHLKVTYPAGGRSVFGIENPYEWSIDVTAPFDPKMDQGKTIVKTSVGRSLKAQYQFMRPLPVAA